MKLKRRTKARKERVHLEKEIVVAGTRGEEDSGNKKNGRKGQTDENWFATSCGIFQGLSDSYVFGSGSVYESVGDYVNTGENLGSEAQDDIN